MLLEIKTGSMGRIYLALLIWWTHKAERFLHDFLEFKQQNISIIEIFLAYLMVKIALMMIATLKDLYPNYLPRVRQKYREPSGFSHFTDQETSVQ